MDHNVVGGLLAAAEIAVAALLIFSFAAMYRKNSKGITKKKPRLSRSDVYHKLSAVPRRGVL